MKIKGQTWFLLVIFALMIGAVFYLNNKKETEAVETTPTIGLTYLFTEADGIVNSIEVSTELGETSKVARDAGNAWTLELPAQTEADQSAAEAAAAQISALMVVSTITSDANPSDFGVDTPVYVITIGFADGKTHTLEVGDNTPTFSGYYVRLDNDKIMIVDLSGIDALAQLASFPPYLNTPTPSPLPPTETPVSPTEGVPTPEQTVTPTP